MACRGSVAQGQRLLPGFRPQRGPAAPLQIHLVQLLQDLLRQRLVEARTAGVRGGRHQRGGARMGAGRPGVVPLVQQLRCGGQVFGHPVSVPAGALDRRPDPGVLGVPLGTGDLGRAPRTVDPHRRGQPDHLTAAAQDIEPGLVVGPRPGPELAVLLGAHRRQDHHTGVLGAQHPLHMPRGQPADPQKDVELVEPHDSPARPHDEVDQGNGRLPAVGHDEVVLGEMLAHHLVREPRLARRRLADQQDEPLTRTERGLHLRHRVPVDERGHPAEARRPTTAGRRRMHAEPDGIPRVGHGRHPPAPRDPQQPG